MLFPYIHIYLSIYLSICLSIYLSKNDIKFQLVSAVAVFKGYNCKYDLKQDIMFLTSLTYVRQIFSTYAERRR